MYITSRKHGSYRSAHVVNTGEGFISAVTSVREGGNDPHLEIIADDEIGGRSYRIRLTPGETETVVRWALGCPSPAMKALRGRIRRERRA